MDNENENETDINDLFEPDTAPEPPAEPDAAEDAETMAPPADYDGSVSEFRDAAPHINAEALAALAEHDSRKGVRDAATSELARRQSLPEPDTEPEPPAEPDAGEDAEDGIDTAVRIRRIDWECECGNTNTHDLRRCGKCHAQRYR